MMTQFEKEAKTCESLGKVREVTRLGEEFRIPTHLTMDPGGDDHAGPSSSWSRDSQHVTSVSSGSFTPSVHGLVSQQQELPGFSHAQFDGQQFQLTDGSNLPYRITLPTGQSAVFQLPHTTFDRLAPSTEYQEATSGGGDIMHAYQEGHVIPLQVLDPNIHRTLQASYTNLQLLQPVSSSVPRVMTPSRSQSELSSNVTSTLSRNQSDLGLAREADTVQSHLMPVDSVSSGAMAMLNPTLTTASSHPTLHSLMTQGEATASFSAHHQRTGGHSSMISNHSEAGATYGGHMEAGPSYSSHVEAGTSEASPLVVHGNADQEVDQTVSSLNLVLGNEAAAQQPPVRAPMLERLESYQNEPDTTQGDSPTCINQEDDFDDSEVNNLAGLDSSMPVSSGQHHMLEQASVGEDSVDVETTGNIDTTGIDDSTTNEGVDSSFMNGDLNVDDDSNIDQATASWSRPTRKSSRLLSIEKDTGPPVRPQYVSKPYNTSELWCEECQQSYESECTAHRLLPVYDKVVLSRAWSSLPGMLQIFRIADDPNAIGVFAKKMVPKRTQFGPFVGELVPDMDSVTNKEFPLQHIHEVNNYDFDDSEVNNLAGLDSSMPVSSGQHHMLEQASVGEDSVDVETTGNIDTTGIDDSTTNEGVDSSFMNGDLNVDDDSNIDQATASWSRPTRKSSRLLSIEKDTGPPVRPQYVSKPYNTSELWCEECQQSYESECTAHRLLPVYDKVVLSRAWSSLPGMLQIFRIADDPNAIGVFAKKMVPKRTQFGPFVGELVPDMDSVTNKEFPLQLIKADSQEMYFNTSDENKCNWMMFVRAAQNFKEQNCVVYQHGEDIFFSVTREIEPREELKVWYAAHYAEKLGKPVFKADLEDQLNLEGMDNQWPCFECNKRFKTSAMLQRHLLTHESAEFDDGEDAKSSKRKSVPQKPGTPRKRGRPPKKQDDIKAETSWGEGGGAGTSGISEGANGSTFQSWKKMKKTMYLNKLKQSRYSSAIKRSIKSLYKKQNNAGTGWVCTHCDLTFDDATLLNLHTLTHAAEDVGLGEVGEGTSDLPQATEQKFDSASATIPWTSLKCPVCDLEFTNKQELIQHAGTHARSRRARLINPLKPYKCTQCWKAFSNEDRLEKHMLCHGSEDSKPLPCSVCYKRFMNNSALACHMKTHSEKKYYECPVCHMGFDMVQVMREHSAVHCFNGVYPCPICSKTFEDFNDIRKHMRFFHPEKQFPCDQCGKVFPRPDKLKLHMLRHSEHREFMCETCGRQFKRKDKLKEHVKRMHTAEREASMQLNSTPNLSNIKKKFTPKVSPSEYHRFIYKCHSCLMGFKRRGMLVNHLAKRHPDVKPESVPELNLPILKTQRDYYCQYCDKVYKSSSKRKAHIMKNHPGAQLPASGRIKQIFEVEQVLQNFPDPTFSQTVGSVTAMPHPCEHCHKQYASKAKLLQHQRKKHPRLAPPMIVRRSMENKQQLDTLMLQQPETDQQGGQPMENSQAADLLTQAMSELTQSLTEYRPQPGGTVEYQLTPRLTPHPGQHTSTIDISHLGQITHLHYTPQGQVQINTGSGSPQQIQVAVSNPQGIQVGSPQPIHVAVPQSQGLTQPIQVAVPNTQGLPQPIQVAVPNSQGLPQSIQVAVSNTQGGIPVTYIPSTWTQAGNFANYR
ncbi:PR domain zinc finger protein 10 [Lingula anatina]|uniref:PR domain zinc finger protein 10 n=1 Tax=Lingula anatina TaxID=7574 RepID=A0A2R2MIF2_LINAN|nr:PR domain zinc finger protein 10 [Lingula anatina]|eukprot:XP_023930001.1 PR domain zinc finger protein 10 [Lingula anatina]